MSLRIMSDLDLSSSDEEIFDGSPSTKSTNTSLNSTNSGSKQTINNDFVIKDVSVKVTQLPIVKSEKHKKNTHKDTQIKKKKRVVRKWRKGIITRRKENRSKRTTPITLKLAENKTEEHAQDQSRIIEEKSTDVHQKLQLAKSCISENLEISDEKKDTEIDRTYTSARILPYDFYRNKNMPTTKYFNFPPFLNDENLEQYLCENNMSGDTACLIRRAWKAQRQLEESKLRRKKLYKQLLKQKKTITDKELLSSISSFLKKNNHIDTDESDSSVEFQPVVKKRRRRISSSESSENIIDNNNSNRPYLSYEGTKQAESQIKIREVKIILTRIEDMINMNSIKQKQGEDASEISKSTVLRQLNTEKARKSNTKVTSEKKNSYITVKDQETVQRQNNELILTRNDGSSQTKDISNDSRLSITSNTHVQKNLKQSDDLYIRKLKKKYKLFKKPRVLLIKFETLQISVKNNQYSASEVERLTKKYINFVIKSNRFMSRTSYGFRQLQNKSTDVNIVHTVDDNASITQNVTRNSTEFAERSPTKDNKPTENNNVKATSLKKFPLSNNLMSMIPIDQYKLLQLHKDKNSVSPEKKQEGFSSQKLLKIWQNAFCKKSTEQSQKTAKKQSASLQSPSVSQDPSKNSADMKLTSVFNHVVPTSLSSTKDDAFATGPKRVSSPKKQAETAAESETAECETVFESLTNCVNLSSNENVEKTIFKNNPLQQNNKQILKSPLDNKNDKNIASRSCLNLTRKMTENAEKDSLKLPEKLSAKSNNITSLVRETKSPRSKTSPQVPQISCEMTKITFKCAKCDIVFEQFRAWQEHHLYLCKQNAIVNSSSGNVLKQQNVESLNPLMSQKTSGNTKSKSPSSQQTLEKRTITCRSCLKVFDNNFQYFEHLNQTNCQFKRVCPIDKTASTSQKTDKQNDQVSKSILKKVIELRAPEKTVEVIEDKLGNTSRDNVKESNAKRRLVTSEVLHDTSKQRNETSNLPKTTEQNKQSIPATRETENHDDEERQAAKPLTICKCHRNIKIVNGENVPIEIVLQCTCCDVLFRLLECFEAHSQSSVFPSCASNSQSNKKAQLFCNICQVMMNSLKDMYRHLAIHAKINRKGTVTFRCNICKLAFYGLGPLFNAHFNNHEKSPGFRSNHLDFPTNTYVGSRLIKMPSADNEKQMNIYYEMADHICPKCKTPFYTPLAVRLHMVTCNVGNVSAVDNNASSTVAKTSIKKKQLILICGFCNKKFCNKAVFDQHSSEHKQKRELNSYYTCVTVTAITKVYICKVCTSMWQSLKEFEEHWRTHGELREDYVCSICESHFNAFDLFEKHVITHKKSVSCKVIYRDVNEQNSTTTSHRQDNDNLSLASVSSCHEEIESIGEKSVTSDKVLSVVTSRKSVIKKSLCEKQNQPTETITAPISDSISSTDITQKSTEAKKNTTTISANDCPKIDNNAKKNNNNETNNLDNLEDSDEDNLVIALSDEENTVSNIVVGNTINNVPLIEHNDDTEKRRAATSNSAATVEQRKQSTDLESVVSSAAISSATNVSEGVSNVITQGETNAQLDKSSDVSGNKEARVDDTNVRSSKTAQDNRANDAIVHPVIIDVVSLNENSKELSNNDINTKSKESSNNDTSTEPKKLSKDKNTENKTFLRVKSLAELTNTPLRSHICYECGQPFDCVQKLTEHITQHDTERRKQASLFNSPIFLAQTPNLAPQPRVPPPSTVNSNQSQQHPILSATSRQYQVIGVKPLHLVAYTVVENKKISPNVLQYEVPWIPHQKNTSAVVTQSSMIQQPTCQPISQVSHQANKLIQNNIQQITLVQQQQQQNTSTVAVRPFMQNFNQGSVSQSVLYEQQQRQQRRQRQLQQWQQQQQQRQQLRQQEIQQQRLQQQQLLQQQQQLQQQQLQQQQLQQQRLQQQQQLQQRQRDNVVHNQYLAPQRNVSPLAQNNTVPAYPANNNASEDLNTIQQAKTPEHLTCLYCPGFECSSIHDFAAHLRSPKHEARSHYNDVPYSS